MTSQSSQPTINVFFNVVTSDLCLLTRGWLRLRVRGGGVFNRCWSLNYCFSKAPLKLGKDARFGYGPAWPAGPARPSTAANNRTEARRSQLLHLPRSSHNKAITINKLQLYTYRTGPRKGAGEGFHGG